MDVGKWAGQNPHFLFKDLTHSHGQLVPEYGPEYGPNMSEYGPNMSECVRIWSEYVRIWSEYVRIWTGQNPDFLFKDLKHSHDQLGSEYGPNMSEYV